MGAKIENLLWQSIVLKQASIKITIKRKQCIADADISVIIYTLAIWFLALGYGESSDQWKADVLIHFLQYITKRRRAPGLDDQRDAVQQLIVMAKLPASKLLKQSNGFGPDAAYFS